MRTNASVGNTCTFSIVQRFRRVLLLTALFVVASLNALAQNITVAPVSVTFTAKQIVGTTSTSKAVTISNSGGSAQPINIVMSGDFTESDNCGGSVAAGGSCTANISFAPTLVGSVSGAASLYDNSNNLLALVGLKGTGEAPVTASPASLSFTGGTIGTISAAKTFKITNNSTASVTITAITTNVSDYTINTGTCLTAALAPAKYCTVSVQVTPTSATDDGAIIIADNAANGVPLVVKLTSAATGGTATPITLSKTSLTFKKVTGGTSATQTITVTNSSASTVTMGTITASSDYAIVNNTCSASLTAGSTCTFGITFNPTFVGSIEGSVAVAYTGNNSPQLVNLSGTSEAYLTVAPASLTFTSQAIGTTSAAKAIKITNNYTSAITLNSVVPSGDFQIASGGTTCPLTSGSLGAGKTCTIEVEFAPTIAGSVVGALTVSNQGSPNPLLIALSGTGTGSSTSASLNPSSAHQGASTTIVITGTNTNFGPTTTVNFGSGITIGTLTVNGPTSASVPITIADTAATGSRTVTITTGSQVVNATFTVVAGVPQVTLINPNTIGTSATESVSVTGAFTNWVSGTTKANFGPGISVGGATAGTFGPVTVNGATSLTANLVTSGAATSSNTVQIQTGSQTLSVTNGMFIQNCTTNAPTVLLFSPVYDATNVPLNTQISMQFSVPMNRSTFSLGNSGSATIFFYDTTIGEQVPATISVDASGTIATITPSGLLAAGHRFYVYLSYSSYIQDTCGNNLGSQIFYFNTAFGPDTTGPALTGTSPVNGDTNIPLNAQINLQFSTQLDPITAQTGFSMTSGGNAVPGTFSYSTNDEIVTFTPVNPLAASTAYTVSYSAQITDTTGNPLSNPGSFSFTTGTASVTTGPSVLLVDPPNGASNVGLNVAPHLTFSEPVNELTIPGNLSLQYYDYYGADVTVPATLTVAANRLSATLTPSSPLLPNTLYYFYLNGNETDIAGNYGYGSDTYFYTGASSDTTPTTVSSISPTNGQTAVPTNTQVVAVMAAQIDPTTITNSAITVKQGTTSVAGTVTLASDNVTLTFVPSAALTASKAYSVSVGGFKDFEGNTVTTFTSSFTTGTVGYASGSFTLVSTSPVNGATGVSVTSPVTFTMSNLIDAASVNPNTVEVYTPNGELLAGTYTVSGASVTFTPLTPYPGNTTISMYVYELTDEAGNAANVNAGSFTTANTLDKTPPTVTISPANGATNVGINTQVVLTFSKSINTSTINTNTLALFSGETAIRYSYSVSLDNRTIVVTPSNYYGTWTSGATISVNLSGGIQDLSGNALAPVSSQFTLTTALPGAAPQVLSMEPSSGSNVPANTVITLFTSAAMNTSSIAGSLFVTDNGVVVSGSLQTFSNGQAIEFTPSAPFGAGDLIQVFLNSTATSADGVPLSAFEGQFYVAGSPANTTAQVQASNPVAGTTNVPLNTVIQVEYNQPLLASTVNNSNITLYQYSTGTYLTPTVTLVGTQVINITSPLVSGSEYQVYISPNSAVTNVDGLAVQPYGFYFTAGTAADTVAPTIVSEAPTNNATNIGTNSAISVNFNKAINPISVTGSTIQVTAGSTTEVPSSISFSPDYTRVSIVPEAPLPASTVITVTINGVTSEAGVAVAKTTTTFTTAAQPDFTAPYVINSSVVYGQTNVPVNSPFSLQFSKPMDIGSLDVASIALYDYFTGQYIPVTISWSADQTTLFLVPTAPLAVGTHYYLQVSGLTDLDGNTQTGFTVYFTTAFVANTNPPAVINTSPENTLTAVPTNSPVEILFTEPIQPTSISQITLTTGGSPVALTPTFSDANQLLTLMPVQPLLAPNATYTLTITGVKDTAGNVMTSTVTNTFTTGPTFDLSNGSVISADPPNGATNIGTNVTPRVVFSKRMNPLSVVTSSNEAFNSGSVVLYNQATGQFVPATVIMSADRTTATLTPTAPLTPNTSYAFEVSYQEYCYDVAGNYSNYYYGTFVTGTGSDTTHATVSTISPVNAQTGVPLNPQIIAVMSDTVDPTTITNSSITLTPQGGSAIAGTVTLASDGVTLTYVPSVVLSASTVYNVSVGGFNDAQSNPVTTFTSSFTTGTTQFGSGSFTLLSTSPANGATGISVTSPVTFNMSNLINPASVNPNSVEVYEYNTGVFVAGTYAVNGASVTFTPLTQYPANTLMQMYVYELADEAGNTSNVNGGTFTTANTVDHTAPTVSITPANGTTNAGLNTQVVLKFSKSINPATISSSSVNLLNGDVPLNPSTSISLDNRTVILNYNNAALPAGATLTVTASSLITDLSGNALANTTSQFTTTAGVSNSAPSVISMLPGNGASLVPANTVITLFTSTPMNAGTIPGALHISQNGVIISGTTNMGSNGQSVEFTPGSALTAGATIQVFLDSTAQDVYGNYLTYYSGQFTVAGSPTNTAAQAETSNPFPGATNVPLNTVIQVEYDQPLLASTVNNSNVTLYQYSTGTYLTPTVTLVGTQVINIATTSNLVSGSEYQVYISPNSAVTNVDGLAVEAYAFYFTAGTATDKAAPTIVHLAPPNSATNIGTNAGVSVSFNKSINPVSVTGSSIQLSGGSVTEVPSSISFTPDYTRTMIIPQAPLPSSTTMTIAISGVTSQAGVAVASQSTTFTTQAGADFSAPYVVNSSVSSGQTVGTNAVFAMQFNKPIDPGSATGENAGNVYIYDNTAGAYVAFTTSFSADLTTIFLKPTANLAASHEVSMYSYNVTDLSGNPEQGFGVTFFTGTGTDTTGPVVKQVNPPSGLTGVGINAPVQILFSEPIDAASLAGVTLKQGSTVVPTTVSEFDGDQGVQLLPLLPLAPSTTYTINVTGVLDITGNAQTSFPSQSFTTGTGTDLVPPTFVSSTPAGGATNVPDGTTIQVVFSEPMDPASFDPNTSFQLQDPSGNVVPGTITFSTNYTTATFTPNATLLSGAQYYMYLGDLGEGYLYDVGGNRYSGGYFYFTTH
jgi:hypothetical protein